MRPEARIKSLDGLRGFAILLVLIYHIESVVELPGRVGRVVASVASVGWTGVDAFFVLSGFLITGILLDSRDNFGYYRSFVLRRALRILPAYYAFLALYLFVLPLLVSAPTAPVMVQEIGTVRESQAWLWLHGANLWIVLHKQLLGAGLSPLWSLSVEEQFYLLWPWVVGACSRRFLSHLCLLLLGGAFAARVAAHALDVDPLRLYFFTLTRLDGLAVGAWLASEMRGPHGLERLRRWAKPCIACAIPLVVYAVHRGELSFYAWPVYTLGYTLFAVSYGGLLVYLLTGGDAASSPARTVFESGVLRFFGRYSYALYLVNWPIMIALQSSRWFPPSWLGAAALAASALSFSVAAALLSWVLLERHALALRHALEPAEWTRPRSVAPTGVAVVGEAARGSDPG